jgi:hypothetical protein
MTDQTLENKDQCLDYPQVFFLRYKIKEGINKSGKKRNCNI